MKIKQSIFVAVIFLAALTACNSAPEGDKATITEKQKASNGEGLVFTVDTSESKVKFTGYGVGKKHPGNFHVSTGTVAIENNQITGGHFDINIKSLEVEQKDEMFQTKLRPHLLSGDFFDADKFGTAKFVITHVEPYNGDDKDTSIVKGANFNISGNFTLKDVTKNITFPARVELDDNTLKGEANFDIDRTQWKMNYGNDKTLKDKFISPTVNVKLDLRATKT